MQNVYNIMYIMYSHTHINQTNDCSGKNIILAHLYIKTDVEVSMIEVSMMEVSVVEVSDSFYMQ